MFNTKTKVLYYKYFKPVQHKKIKVTSGSMLIWYRRGKTSIKTNKYKNKRNTRGPLLNMKTPKDNVRKFKTKTYFVI